MLSVIIAILMSTGLISTPHEYNDLSSSEQMTLNEWIVEDDLVGQ